ncbi:CLUMA_CG018588, isoform A [Clunio marinus]|uniref:CLUMA_CG018588, isoform A n=1 Tax=Clunio marinus TaxID=568069 RepID=A0A1J1IYB2_9DIPT|nr:CLUMA_CG018588, isoform A [Clunio marinus]
MYEEKQKKNIKFQKCEKEIPCRLYAKQYVCKCRLLSIVKNIRNHQERQEKWLLTFTLHSCQMESDGYNKARGIQDVVAHLS